MTSFSPPFLTTINSVLWAVRYDRFITIRRLLKNGADINSDKPSRNFGNKRSHFWFEKATFRQIDDWHPFTVFTPLALAAKHGLASMVTFLLHHGANIEKPGKGLCDCSFFNAQYLPFNLPFNQETILEPCPDSNMGMFWWTPLHIAVCHRHESTTKLLLSRGADPENTCPCDWGPWSALHTATHLRAHSIVECLLDDE